MNKGELKEISDKLVTQYAAIELKEGFKLTCLHNYDDEEGNLLYIRLRLKHCNERKWIRPFHFDNEKQEWVMGEPKFTNGKPLYHLSSLAENPDAETWIAEGEQKVEALEKLGFTATTSGSCTSASNANWEILCGRSVVIWPDFNDVGTKYAEEVIAILHSLNCKIRVVDVNKLNLPNGGDVIDYLSVNANTTYSDIAELPMTEKLNISEKNPHIINSIIISRCASDIEMKAISWLWKNRFALGKLSMIAGEPGLGKSQVTASMTAIITSGLEWPDGEKCEKGNVIILSAEDDAADTIVPRLSAAGANLNSVQIIDNVRKITENENEELNQFNLANDLPALENMIIEIGNVKAIFIDPIASYLGAKIDDHKNAAVRSILTPLSKLAEKHNIAIICITHLNKCESQKAINRMIGSIGFVAAARAAFGVIRDNDDKDKRLFIPIKNNIGNDRTGLAFYIEPHDLEDNIKSSRIKWSNEIINDDADELLNRKPDAEEKSALEEAKEFLIGLLSKEGMHSTEIIELAKSEGIAEKTLSRAKRDLKIESKREGFGKGSKGFWHLTNAKNDTSIDGQNSHTQPLNLIDHV
ncbi:MAG: hypothetical protein COY58_09205 [Gammaproteobacteria bacterium CG_4_10_14_0_8_um_filter_38_16]|nr:MAG: hypothetical protein COY58_09205 [Gammaproteobacteria bacterium CG_4_10_14_0_8_um_filter_38_16]PJA04168.1 MAG: hypothetical protein COX72_01520 [Gammaproteobacteria bacterium CG_4_10_14_0_2_um_filter_38_22]PJB10109.1 MAG: hypothetical protein CO120_06855 [Gammaproteobacteria bacterium CG_4_9_14_3_um_filter_38_9]